MKGDVASSSVDGVGGLAFHQEKQVLRDNLASGTDPTQDLLRAFGHRHAALGAGLTADSTGHLFVHGPPGKALPPPDILCFLPTLPTCELMLMKPSSGPFSLNGPAQVASAASALAEQDGPGVCSGPRLLACFSRGPRTQQPGRPQHWRAWAKVLRRPPLYHPSEGLLAVFPVFHHSALFNDCT